MQELTEGITSFTTNSEEKISKEMPIFYNPRMQPNRDITLLFLAANNWKSDNVRLAFPLEASGVRVARLLNEVVAPKLFTPQKICVNDISPSAVKLCKLNLEKNRREYPKENITFSNKEANMFLLEHHNFEYIDIDPFGSPNQFLDCALKRLSRGGIIAVTATDTSALSGTYPRTTKRKYWSTPSRTWMMHEIGLRILIRKVQLVAAQYEKALEPVLSFCGEHYYRVFFKAKRGSKVENLREIFHLHEYLHLDTENGSYRITKESTGSVSIAGPLWTGPLHDKEIVSKMRELSEENEEFKKVQKTLEIMDQELATPGFYSIHDLAKKHNFEIPKTERVLEKFKGKTSRTHISPYGVKAEVEFTDLLDFLRHSSS
jgi:tRNA (guanine26-N2/guanine27-N2)-dimethyltransferase